MTSKPLSHDIHQVLECRKANYVLHRELEKYCVNKQLYNHEQCQFTFTKDIERIADSYANGHNPNDIAIMNMIRGELNKLNHSNYPSRIEILRKLAYSNEDHFSDLAKDLITHSMTDPTVIRDTLESDNDTSPTELYVGVIIDFSELSIECDERVIKFKNVMLAKCLEKIKEFTDKSIKLDTNNQHSINIYKGFMNMMGLLHAKEYLSDDFAFKCLDKIASIISSETLPQNESDNYYSGYDKFVNHLLKKYEIMLNDSNLNKTQQDAIKSTFDRLSACNKEISKTKKALRKFSSETHEQNVGRLNKFTKILAAKSKKSKKSAKSTIDPVDPVDPIDPVDPVDPVDSAESVELAKSN